MANRVILLDTTPLGLVTHPNPLPTAIACRQWLHAHLALGSRVIVPEIADYELRRELLRANRRRGLSYLDRLIQQIEYVVATVNVKHIARFVPADLWQNIM